MVTAFAYPLMAGIATHVHEVATRLGAAGVDVTVLTTDRTGELPVEEQLPGYRVRRFRAYPRSRDYYLAPGLARHLLRADDYDIVHVEGVHFAGHPGRARSSAAGRHPVRADAAHRRPLVRHCEIHCARCSGGYSRRCSDPLRLSWQPGEYERQTFAALLGDTEGAIRLIRNGSEPLPVDRSAEKLEGSPLLVSVGRLERLQGPSSHPAGVAGHPGAGARRAAGTRRRWALRTAAACHGHSARRRRPGVRPRLQSGTTRSNGQTRR